MRIRRPVRARDAAPVPASSAHASPAGLTYKSNWGAGATLHLPTSWSSTWTSVQYNVPSEIPDVIAAACGVYLNSAGSTARLAALRELWCVVEDEINLLDPP